jgi:AcrR family transcriptional regulator
MAKEAIKYRLSEAVKECMKTQPVEKITVSQIVSECGVSRQTFYRNFLDKYDLINWYFDRLVMESFEQIGLKTTIQECLIKKFYFIKKERVFFCAAFRGDDYNSLKEHDFRMILSFYETLIKERNPKVLTQEIQTLLEMYCQASVYMTVKWILGGLTMEPEQLAKVLVDAIPPKLYEVLNSISLL